MKFKNLLLLLIVILSIHLHAQTEENVKYTANNKGKFFISWGGNRGDYSKSDITFKGEHYNFTIKDATAQDVPKGYHIDYINPTRMTIPQTNLKIGYFISNHYSITFGVDHMKYVMDRNRTRVLNGFINFPEGDVNEAFNANFNNEEFFVSEDFLKFEHTNGLNYVSLAVHRHDDVSSLFHINNTDKLQVNMVEGVGAGVLYPRTNTTLLGNERYDEFHISGYGISIDAGINITFFKYFFIEADLKGGYIDMPDIRTTMDSADSASQHFFFLERIISLGSKFRV